MCQPDKHLMFCTCANEVKVKTIKNRYGDTYTQKVFPKYIQFIWTLRRHIPEPSTMDGMLEMPSDQLGGHLTSEYVLAQLNASSCFDFVYQPQDKDNLVITSNQKITGFLSFIFQEGQWVKGQLSPFECRLETLQEGKSVWRV